MPEAPIPDSAADSAASSDLVAPGDPTSSLPSVPARIFAFCGILVSAALGGAIGYWFIDIQCDASCSVKSGFAMMTGTLVLGLGAAVIAIISLRVAAEWGSLRR